MGEYSKNIPRNKALKMVEHPERIKKLSRKYRFWFNMFDNNLHFGIHSLEGELTLNSYGKSVFERTLQIKNRDAYGMYVVNYGGVF